LTVTGLSGSIASAAGVGSGERVLEINGIRPQTAQEIVDIIEKMSYVSMTLGEIDPMAGAQVTRLIAMNPQNGKVGIQIGYRDLHINANKKIQYN
jgi:hypothetical protein